MIGRLCVVLLISLFEYLLVTNVQFITWKIFVSGDCKIDFSIMFMSSYTCDSVDLLKRVLRDWAKNQVLPERSYWPPAFRTS